MEFDTIQCAGVQYFMLNLVLTVGAAVGGVGAGEGAEVGALVGRTVPSTLVGQGLSGKIRCSKIRFWVAKMIRL